MCVCTLLKANSMGERVRAYALEGKKTASSKHLFKWGAIFRIGNGSHCKFWLDRYIMLLYV